jgi:PAS domain-containing protein
VEIDLQAQELTASRLDLEVALTRLSQRHDHAPVSCLTMDEQGRLTEVNDTAARHLHTNGQALIGQAFERLLSGLSTKDWCAWLQRLDAPGQGPHTTVTGELTLKLPDGTPWQVHASVTRDPAGPHRLIALMDQ